MTQETKRMQTTPGNTPVEHATGYTPTLLVVGAGPKAVAIAAKRQMLAKLGYPVPHVRIIDRKGVATHWIGKAGYTDGHQFLGTRPEKDIGFPYLSACWGVQEVEPRGRERDGAPTPGRVSSSTSCVMPTGSIAGAHAPHITSGHSIFNGLLKTVELELCVGEVTSVHNLDI